MTLRGRLEEIIGKGITIRFEEGGFFIDLGNDFKIKSVGEDCFELNNGDIIAIRAILRINGFGLY
jgi:hypothetical protein